MSKPAAIAAMAVAAEAGAGEVGFSCAKIVDNPSEAIEPSTGIVASAMTRATA